MRAREIKNLKDGDYIYCDECPDFGCDGTTPRMVYTMRNNCGCLLYFHHGNQNAFYILHCKFHSQSFSAFGEWGDNRRVVRTFSDQKWRQGFVIPYYG